MGASSGRPFSLVATNQEKPKPETKKEEGRALPGTRAYIWIGPNGLFVQSNLERCGSSSKRTLAFSQMRIPSGLWTALLTSPNSCSGSTVRVTTSQSGLKTHLRTQGRDGAPGGCSKEELTKRDTHKLVWCSCVSSLYSDGARPPSVVSYMRTCPKTLRSFLA